MWSVCCVQGKPVCGGKVCVGDGVCGRRGTHQIKLDNPMQSELCFSKYEMSAILLVINKSQLTKKTHIYLTLTHY